MNHDNKRFRAMSSNGLITIVPPKVRQNIYLAGRRVEEKKLAKDCRRQCRSAELRATNALLRTAVDILKRGGNFRIADVLGDLPALQEAREMVGQNGH